LHETSTAGKRADIDGVVFIGVEFGGLEGLELLALNCQDFRDLSVCF
jgi:hypothetical protein